MNPELIECKSVEYSGKLGAAIALADLGRARELALTLLVLYRLRARAAHEWRMNRREELRGLERAVRKSEADGVTCVFSKRVIDRRREECTEAAKALANIGELIVHTLNIWQGAGATFDDLCNLCNRNPEQARKELYDFYHRDPDFVDEESGDEWIEREPFSVLATVHNLDYKNPYDTGFLEDSVDAPLTHALKAHMLDEILHTEAGRKAAHKAMEAVFPDVMGSALTVITDKNGVRHLYDKDGEEVGILGDEGNEPQKA